MEESIERNVASIPEAEARALLPKLRHALPGVGLSVSAFVDRKNRRLLHVAADNPKDDDDRMDIYYPADKPTKKILDAAVRKITTRFALHSPHA